MNSAAGAAAAAGGRWNRLAAAAAAVVVVAAAAVVRCCRTSAVAEGQSPGGKIGEMIIYSKKCVLKEKNSCNDAKTFFV